MNIDAITCYLLFKVLSDSAFVFGAEDLWFKSDTLLPTAPHRCDISSNDAVFSGRIDPDIGLANSL